MAQRRSGFTLIELLIFSGIFALIVGAFITILVGSVSVQSSQSAENEVSTQGQALIQQIQYYVQGAKFVDMPLDTATSTLTLREPDLSQVTIGQGGPVSVVQTSTFVAQFNRPSATVTLPSSVTAGDTIILHLVWWPNTPPMNITSVTDTQGDQFTVAPGSIANYNSGTDETAIAYATNVKGGSDTITALMSGWGDENLYADRKSVV